LKHIESKIEILTQDEIEQIHAATLEVLEKTGCRLPHPYILDQLEGRGAQVDRQSGIARLPGWLVETALRETRPRQADEVNQPGEGGRQTADLTFAGSEVSNGRERAYPFRRGRFSISPGNEAAIIDYKATSRRMGTAEDVVKGIVLTNELPYVSGCMPLVTPTDCPGHVQDVYGYYLCTLYSKKPYSVYICSPGSARMILRMWEAVKDEPARKNFPQSIGYLLEPNGALSYDVHSLEMARIFAEAGQDIYVGPMAMAGLDAPVTLAGTMVMQNAYNLAAVVVCWLLGRPGGWSGSAHTADMRNMLCSFGSPNQVLIALAAIQLGRFYGYEAFVNSALTDACLPDFQGGFEKGMSGMVALLAGAGGIGAQGIVGADQGTSFEQLVIDNEWASAFDHIFSRGVEVTPETLAVELINKVGVGGSFIAEEHTVQHARNTYWKSNLFNQASWDAWMVDGGKDVYQKAHEKVQAILAAHYPPELQVSAEDMAILDHILEEAKTHPEEFWL
jgi:trimethylamine---corrinoid protein Co-methyltransferase